MNPIQQAVDVLQELHDEGEISPQKLNPVLTSLRSLQKEVEGVLPEPHIKACPAFVGALPDCYTADQLRTAVAAALGRGEVPQGRRVFLFATGELHEGEETYTRHDDAPPPLCDAECLYTTAPTPEATQPTQAEAPSEREAFEASEPGRDYERSADGDYASPWVSGDWHTWRQAWRAALATQQAVQVEPPEGIARARYTLSIVADSGYEATTEGVCTAEQYGAAIGALHGTIATPPAPGQGERDREDAENYRWLCSHMIVPSPSLWDRGVAFTTPPMPRKAGQMTKAELDDFIRAARSSDGGSND